MLVVGHTFKDCPKHGWTDFVLLQNGEFLLKRCKKCEEEKTLYELTRD